ncbi:MAG: CD225/dispanin family protein [Bacteroidota bacterium]
MRQYYYSDGQERFGPFSLEELRTKYLTASTLVWHEELDDWKRADQLEELKSLFEVPLDEVSDEHPNTPVFAESETSVLDSPKGPKPKTWLVEAILVTVLCCLPFGIAGIIFASRVDSKYMIGDFEGAQKASEDAKKWTMIGLIAGIAVMVIYFIYIFVMVGSMGALDTYDY